MPLPLPFIIILWDDRIESELSWGITDGEWFHWFAIHIHSIEFEWVKMCDDD